MNHRAPLSLLCLCLLSWATALADDKPVSKPLSFVREVRPILAKHCFACHGPDEKHREANLRLDQADSATAAREGRRAVVPGKPDSSEVIRRVTSADTSVRMPPADAGQPLTAEQIDVLRRWIAQGAIWERHWSFDKLTRPTLPAVREAGWAQSDLDRFVLARLVKEGLAPSPEADPHALIRRVSLDLIGLPPEPEMARRFAAAPSPQAYERVVDELLRSRHFGERWARPWLDLARYADTKGYEKDLGRTMWRYRDWVIDALNADMPFDQFTREQLAGDLLPNPTIEQLLATAFHRNTMINDEGGTDNEEFRVAAVKDRVDTTLQVWMGLTAGCAKCHSHKYDPITTREYYQLYAFLNQTEDADDFDERPKIPTPTAEQRSQQAALQAKVRELEQRLVTDTPELRAAVDVFERDVVQRAGWIVAKPSDMKAASGSSLKAQGDGSILAEAKSPAKETYTVSFPAGLRRFTGLRLEALPDKSHPRGGVGRSPNDGNFVLSGIEIAIRSADGKLSSLPLAKAKADFSQDNYPVEHALKNSDTNKHGWAVAPQQTNAHTAVFTTEKPVDLPEGTVLTVRLDHSFEFSYSGFSIGRFRLAVTGDAQPSLAADPPAEVLAIVRTPAAKRTPAQRERLLRHAAGIAAATKPLRDQIAAVQKQLADVPIPQTPILRELPPERRRTTKVHVRGNFLDQGEAVEPTVPTAFHPWPQGAPLNRLGLAAWLTEPANPLTARVQANRVWSQFFGVGLVETQEDFGSQGQPPTHQELLDWLATEYVRNGWSLKKLCKTIVLSATYRQASRTTPELAARDRFNRLLARGPRFRLEAEMVRDNALAVSGLLSRQLHGPSVMPPQPDGVWRSTYNTSKWINATGEDRYRRGLYTYVKRTSPYPAMTTLDAPSREVCAVRRITTNTPLQALVTLNDEAYLEMAQALTRRMVREAGPTPSERIAHGLQLALVRPAKPREVEALLRLYESRRKFYAEHADAAKQLATVPLGPLPQGWDVAELAALTAVANVILNLDEFLTRG